MPPTANIVKALYLNNRLWREADTNSISGTVRSWGSVPSCISFSLHRHFDSDGTDTSQVLPAFTPLRHLDNVKLFIAPASANVQWPDVYTGKCNDGDIQEDVDYPYAPGVYTSGSPGDAIQTYLYWQGYYVERELDFDIDDSSGTHGDSVKATCYDARWFLTHCLQRFRNIVQHTWSDAQRDSDYQNNGWSTSAEVEGFDFIYNGKVPRSGVSTRPWVHIVEHLMRQVLLSANQSPDHGLLNADAAPNAAHVPCYPTEGHMFRAEISVRGLRLDSEYAERLFVCNDRDLAISKEFAPASSDEQNDREFPISPLTVSGDMCMDAVDKVLGMVGGFGCWMDEWNCLHFCRTSAPHEIPIPTGLETTNVCPASGYADKVYPPNNRLYLVWFANDDGTVEYGRRYNCRGISGLRPRQAPEANRVIGILEGRGPVAQNVKNDDAAGEYVGGSLENEVWHITEDVFQNRQNTDAHGWNRDTARSVKKAYIHRSHKMLSASGKIRKPISIVPYVYAINGQTVTRTPVRTDEQGGTDLKYGAHADGNLVLLPAVAPAVGYQYAFRVRFGIFPASVTVKEIKVRGDMTVPEDTPTGSNSDQNGPYQGAVGGHDIVLTEPLCTFYDLVDVTKQAVAKSGNVPAFTALNHEHLYICITHGWGASGVNCSHNVQFRNHAGDWALPAAQVPGVSDNYDPAYNMGIAPNAEYYSIDSSLNALEAGSAVCHEWGGPGAAEKCNFTLSEDEAGMPFPGLGEFDRAVIDTAPIRASVDELVPTYSDDPETGDEALWRAKWEAAKLALKRRVRKEALRLRQLVTVGTLPILFDSDLMLTDRVCVLGTRDDLRSDSEFAMRLKSMRGRINSVRIESSGELALEFTTEKAFMGFSIYTAVYAL